MPNTDDLFMQSKAEIDDILARAQSVLEPKLAPVRAVMDSIKTQLAHGTDRIPTSTINEWAVSLSVFTSELTPQKEAYALSAALWAVDIKKSNAKNLLERRAERKKVDVETQNIVDSADKETQKVILDYMANVIKGIQDNIYQMCSELNRIMDGRTRNNENK